jgi:hypothetical protein
VNARFRPRLVEANAQRCWRSIRPQSLNTWLAGSPGKPRPPPVTAGALLGALPTAPAPLPPCPRPTEGCDAGAAGALAPPPDPRPEGGAPYTGACEPPLAAPPYVGTLPRAPPRPEDPGVGAAAPPPLRAGGWLYDLPCRVVEPVSGGGGAWNTLLGDLAAGGAEVLLRHGRDGEALFPLAEESGSNFDTPRPATSGAAAPLRSPFGSCGPSTSPPAALPRPLPP